MDGGMPMKKSLVMAIGVALVMALALPSADAQTYKWRFQTYAPSLQHVAAQGAKKFCDLVNERSKGKLKIELFLAGTLGYGGFEMHRVTGEGLIEMGETTAAAITEVPEFGVFSQMIYKNGTQVKTAWDEIRPDLIEAMKKINCRLIYGAGKELDNWTSTKKLASMDDFKGLKARAWNPLLAQWLKGVGAVPYVIPYAEVYTSLATKVIEADAKEPKAVVDLKLYEVTKYFCTWPLQPAVYVAFINLKAFNGLPKDLQDVLVDSGKEVEAWLWEQQLAKPGAPDPYLQKIRELGMEVVEPPPTELEKAKKAGETYVLKPWMDGATPEARALMDRVLKRIGK
jgi:TRAP-type C4-dicarboxylate transport system substrate-binding protein